MKPRQPIPRISKKRLAANGGKTPFLKRSAIRKKTRKPSEFKRIYGSKARVAFVKSRPCVACLAPLGESDNAHIETGGVGYKADNSKIVPLCRVHHNLFHQEGRQWFEAAYNLNLAAIAAETESAWLAFSGDGGRCYACESGVCDTHKSGGSSKTGMQK